MTDREALYRAILADPDDDTLRLVYADALEEAGEPRRAAFIRTQIQLRDVPEYDPAWIRIRFHDRDKMPGAWIRELPELPGELQWAHEPFRRGFPANVRAALGSHFLEHADALFARFPIEAVELGEAQLSAAKRLAESPWVSRLVRLSLPAGMGAATARRLFGSANYVRLRELHIGARLTTVETAQAVVRSRMFRHLTMLSCRDDQAGGRILVNELTQLADPPKLRVLDLAGNRLAAEQIARLVAAPALSAVEELDLADNDLRAASALQAIAAARLPHLRSLHLLRTNPRQEGIEALAGASFLRELRSLSLGENRLRPAAAQVLAATPSVANLSVLDLRENRLEDAGAIAIASSPHLRNLVHLDLSQNLIEDDGLNALADSPHLQGLIYLDLHGNLPTPAAEARLRHRFGDRVFL